MSVSTISYHNNEFLTLDFLTQLFCQYLCKTMENKGLTTYSSALQSAYDKFKMTKEGLVFIDVDLYFEVYLQTPQDIIDMVGVLNDTKTYLAALGDEISDVDLNTQEAANKTQIEEITDWTGAPVKTKSLINFCNLVIELLTVEKFDKQGIYTFVGFEQDIPQIKTI